MVLCVKYRPFYLIGYLIVYTQLVLFVPVQKCKFPVFCYSLTVKFNSDINVNILSIYWSVSNSTLWIGKLLLLLTVICQKDISNRIVCDHSCCIQFSVTHTHALIWAHPIAFILPLAPITCTPPLPQAHCNKSRDMWPSRPAFVVSSSQSYSIATLII